MGDGSHEPQRNYSELRCATTKPGCAHLQQVSVLNLSVTGSLFLVRRSIALAISVPRSCNTYPPVACSFGSADTPPCGRSELRVNEGPVCHCDVFVSPRQGRPSTPFHGCQQRCDRDKAEPPLCGVSERLFRAAYRVSRHPPEFPRLTATVRR